MQASALREEGTVILTPRPDFEPISPTREAGLLTPSEFTGLNDQLMGCGMHLFRTQTLTLQ